VDVPSAKQVAQQRVIEGRVEVTHQQAYGTVGRGVRLLANALVPFIVSAWRNRRPGVDGLDDQRLGSGYQHGRVLLSETAGERSVARVTQRIARIDRGTGGARDRRLRGVR